MYNLYKYKFEVSSVENLIVTGQIPGTEIYISFENVVAFVAVVSGIWMLFLVAKSLLSSPAKHTQQIQTKTVETIMNAEELHAEPLTIIHPTQSA